MKSSSWSFNNFPISQFDNHIEKSIPFYKDIHDLILSYSSFFIKKNSLIYDLGCSTGSSTKIMAKSFTSFNPKIFAIDESQKMISFAKKHNKFKNIFYSKKKIEKIKFRKCDLIIMAFTLQFISPKYRQKLISNIFKNLNWGGALIIFEKIRAQDARYQDYVNFLYSDYKLKMNYTYEEIHSKASLLKGVLEPYTSRENKLFLKRAGFKDFSTIFKYLCFEGILAIK